MSRNAFALFAQPVCRRGFVRQPRFAAGARLRRGGVVLVLSMVLVMLLAIVLFAFQRTVYTESVIAENRRMSIATGWAARGGITIGIAYLELDDEPAYDSLNQRWASVEPVYPRGDADVEIEIVDEARKFNVLALIDEDEDVREWAETMLEALIRVARNEDNESLGSNELPADRIVENIREWLEDTDGGSGRLSFGDSPRLGSDLDDEEADESIPKTSPFPILTIGELRMVRGVTRELLFGPDRTEFERREEETRPRFGSNTNDEEEPERRALLDFITCYGTDPRRININTAPREVLLHLDSEMPEQLVDAIIQSREQETGEDDESTQPEMEEDDEDEYSFRTEHLANRDAFQEKLGSDAPTVDEELWERIQPRLAVRSSYFTVIATATAHQPGARSSGGGGGAGYYHDDLDQQRTLGRMTQTWRAVVIRTHEGDRARARLLMINME